MRVTFRAAGIIFVLPFVVRGQTDTWQNPVRFEANNSQRVWAVTATFRGQVVSDGKVVDVSVESCELSRARSFDSAQQVVAIAPGIVRHREGGQWQPVIQTDRIPVDLAIAPGQSVLLPPFHLRFNIADYPLATGDSLFFNLVFSNATVPVHATTALPVTQSPAYCAVSWEQFGGKSPVLQVRHVCQDRFGRRRTEDWIYPYMDAPESSATLGAIHIADPVGNWIYDFNPREKKVLRRKGFTTPAGFGVVMGGILAPPPGGVPAPPGASGVPPPQPNRDLRPTETNQWLGRRQVNGVQAEGNRVTTVYPAGYFGPQETRYVREVWYSWQARREVRTVTTHTVYGDSRFDLKDIVFGDPDPTLFRVPVDFEIVDR